MTTGAEKVVNNPLSGTEMKQLIMEDCQRLIDNEGTLSPHVAFGRVGYSITLTIQTGNVYYPQSKIVVEGGEKLPMVDPPPDASLGATTLQRNITSPNSERVRVGLPVPVVTRDQSGTTQTEMVKYPPQPELGEGDVKVEDTTQQAKQAFAK